MPPDIVIDRRFIELHQRIKTCEEMLDKLIIAINNAIEISSANTEHLKMVGEYLLSADASAEKLVKLINKGKQ